MMNKKMSPYERQCYVLALFFCTKKESKTRDSTNGVKSRLSLKKQKILCLFLILFIYILWDIWYGINQRYYNLQVNFFALGISLSIYRSVYVSNYIYPSINRFIHQYRYLSMFR